ncbi:ABC transporter ATP-binding protein [Leptotrichia hongkongensis]|uniref:ABC transporter ATP-binding protein n=1 Tax=Leptotrichia hongkongensis TaxID=554406 RepID=UPI0035A884DB
MSHIIMDKVCLNYKVKKDIKFKDLVLGNKSESKFSEMSGEGIIRALNEVTLELHDGDRLAIIGPNGAGKSSLLKVMSEIYPISKGKLDVSGNVATMFEMATGFDMDASGWENIRLRGIMLGLTPKEIEPKVQEIAEFSELGEYLDIPVRYYSSGMFIRLAFSVSTSVDPDILLLDEVLAAGDAGFVDKANKRINEMMKSAKILVLVTHSMESAIKFCNKAILLKRGKILKFGTPIDIVDYYLKTV